MLPSEQSMLRTLHDKNILSNNQQIALLPVVSNNRKDYIRISVRLYGRYTGSIPVQILTELAAKEHIYIHLLKVIDMNNHEIVMHTLK